MALVDNYAGVLRQNRDTFKCIYRQHRVICDNNVGLLSYQPALGRKAFLPETALGFTNALTSANGNAAPYSGVNFVWILIAVTGARVFCPSAHCYDLLAKGTLWGAKKCSALIFRHRTVEFL